MIGVADWQSKSSWAFQNPAAEYGAAPAPNIAPTKPAVAYCFSSMELATQPAGCSPYRAAFMEPNGRYAGRGTARSEFAFRDGGNLPAAAMATGQHARCDKARFGPRRRGKTLRLHCRETCASRPNF